MNSRSIFGLMIAAAFSVNASGQYYKLVDPLIGSSGDGNVFIGPSCPFGMVKPGPDCNKAANSGYSPDTMKTVYGFSQVPVSYTHLTLPTILLV